MLSDIFVGDFLPLALIGAGVFYNFYLGFFYLRHPIKTFALIFKKDANSGVSPASALGLALAGTLGVGNIVGVSSAIYLGGAGALFWMLISALAAMVLKYAEITLSLTCRHRDEKGENHGGAVYYIKEFFASHKMKSVGLAVAAIFTLLCLVDALCVGSVIQVNAISQSFSGVLGVPTYVSGAVLAVLCFIIICKGRKRILSFTDKLVPIMTLGYVVISLAVIFIRLDGVADAVRAVLEGALKPSSAAGGILGFLINRGVRYGVMRGLLSNEAGCGTAPFAHSSSDAKMPARQGVMGIAEVFVDTVVLCSMTGLVVLLSYDSVIAYGENPMMMTVKAYSAVLGGWSEYFMCAAVLLFGFATVICWASYAEECVRYLFGSGVRFMRAFSLIYSASVFVGALFAPSGVWLISDIAIGIMTLINLFVLLGMRKKVRELSLDLM